MTFLGFIVIYFGQRARAVLLSLPTQTFKGESMLLPKNLQNREFGKVQSEAANAICGYLLLSLHFRQVDMMDTLKMLEIWDLCRGGFIGGIC